MNNTQEHEIDTFDRDNLKKVLLMCVRSMFDRRYKATDKQSNYEILTILSRDLYNLANDIRATPEEIDARF